MFTVGTTVLVMAKINNGGPAVEEADSAITVAIKFLTLHQEDS